MRFSLEARRDDPYGRALVIVCDGCGTRLNAPAFPNDAAAEKFVRELEQYECPTCAMYYRDRYGGASPRGYMGESYVYGGRKDALFGLDRAYGHDETILQEMTIDKGTVLRTVAAYNPDNWPKITVDSVPDYNFADEDDDLDKAIVGAVTKRRAATDYGSQELAMEQREVERYEETIRKLRDAVAQQNEMLEKLMTPPIPYATVLQKTARDGKDYAVVVDSGGGLMDVEAPSFKISPGDLVRVTAETGQIIDLAEDVSRTGEVCIVRKVHDGSAEVDYNGSTRIVLVPKSPSPVKVADGDRVVVDRSVSVIISSLGKEDDKFAFEGETGVRWDDIGGLEDAKRTMIEAVVQPRTHKDLFERYGKKPTKGVLLYGPPGCGKTMIGKATASAVAELVRTGKPRKNGFIYVKGPEILNMYVGNSEATIRQLFATARDFYKKNGFQAVLFIDEADAILGKRGSGISSDIERTIVPMFLAEMDGLDDSGAMVLLATNRPDTLDPAVVRDGRVDRKVKIGRPGLAEATDIFVRHLRGKPTTFKGELKVSAAFAAEMVFAPENLLYSIIKKSGEAIPFALKDIASGAMIAGVVDQAVQKALSRDIKNGSFAGGITPEDIQGAVHDVLCQNKDMDHTDDLELFVEPFRSEVAGIRKAA